MMGWSRDRVRRVLASAVVIVLGSAWAGAHAQPPASPPYVPGEILVKFKAGVASEATGRALSAARLQSVQHFASLDIHRCAVPAGSDVAAALLACKTDPTIEYAEPNYIYRASRTPNDPRFGELWGLHSAGDVDIDGPEAWDAQTGDAQVLVAIIDTGIDPNHEDLTANVWRNPGETGGGRERNGRDDDGNGFVDDVTGWDFAGDDNDPMDDNGHGTHVAGTIGAMGDNARGVVGVNWRVSIMALKFLTANGSGTAADAIEAILYAAANGARVMNNSWGGGGFSQALRDAIEAARQKNAVFVAAAGNEGRDNDATPSYPASYDVANVLSIAASDAQDALAGFSNFGKTSVDLAAPGVDILSTVPGNGYRSFSGTSMATPHASGVAALLFARYPQATYRQVLVRMAGSVDAVGAFATTTWNGGRLNAAAALDDQPKVAFVTRLDAGTVPVGPWRVGAEAVAASAIAKVELGYSVGTGTPTVLAMQKTTAEAWTAEIPSQASGAEVSYSVTATDVEGRTAKSRTITFRVGENAGVPGCGDFTLPTARTNQGRLLLVLGNALLVLLGIEGARRIQAARRPEAPIRRH